MAVGTLVTLDLETIPDVDLAEYLTDTYKCPDSPDMADVVEDLPKRLWSLEDYMRKKRGLTPEQDAPMLPVGLNKIVTAGLHIANIHIDATFGEWYETKHLSSTADDERAILLNLTEWFSKILPRIVTYNGRHFDLPLLTLRGLKHRVPMKFLLSSGDKYNNYMNRYSLDWHFDVMDFLGWHGASDRYKLREIMALLNLPDKLYSGANVVDLYQGGSMNVVREYCECDCLNEFMTYVHCQHLRGAITKLGLEASIDSLVNWLRSKYSSNAYLEAFLREWCRLDADIRIKCPELYYTVGPTTLLDAQESK